MYNRLIIFLLRCKFGLKKNQHFMFVNQRSLTDSYYFTSDKLMKYTCGKFVESNVKFNWLMDNECKIEKIPMVGGKK